MEKHSGRCRSRGTEIRRCIPWNMTKLSGKTAGVILPCRGVNFSWRRSDNEMWIVPDLHTNNGASAAALLWRLQRRSKAKKWVLDSWLVHPLRCGGRWSKMQYGHESSSVVSDELLIFLTNVVLRTSLDSALGVKHESHKAPQLNRSTLVGKAVAYESSPICLVWD